MRQARAREEEVRLEAEKRFKFNGTARIRLEEPHFLWNNAKELNEKNVDRLKAIFQQHGCNRYHPECLHGQNRIQAGEEFLPARDKWWTVDLYLTSITESCSVGWESTDMVFCQTPTRSCLIEEYSNEEKPGEGEIYRKIRQYHFQRNLSFENRRWARLTPHGRKNLKGLLRRRELTAAFDVLLDIPGLDHIRNVWLEFLHANQAALQKVDEITVTTLELTAPRASTVLISSPGP